MFCLARDLLCLAALLACATSCTEETCEEQNVTLLQRKLQLEQPQPRPLPSLSVLQDGTSKRLQNAACSRQASPARAVALHAGGGPVANVGEALECVVHGTRIKRDSGEQAVGPFRAIDAVTTKALAAEPPNKEAAVLCIFAAVNNVVFNRELTMIMNRTTRMMEHTIYLLKRYPDDPTIQFALLQMVAGGASGCCPELTPFVVRLGGMDVLFAAIDNFQDNPDVMMSAWRGLSDHSHNAVGAAVIANHGGPMKGIHFVVEQMRIHPEPHLAESPIDHLSLKYEIMQIVNGMLENDDDNTYGAAFMAEGLPELMLRAMRVEPDLRATQEVACDCMQWLLLRDPTAAQVFEGGGAVQVLAAALDRYRKLEDNTPWCGSTLGESYPVVGVCSRVLVQLGLAQPAAVDEMLQLGLLSSISDVLPELESSVEPLRELLRAPPRR